MFRGSLFCRGAMNAADVLIELLFEFSHADGCCDTVYEDRDRHLCWLYIKRFPPCKPAHALQGSYRIRQ